MYQKFTIPQSTIIKCFILAHRQGGDKNAIIQRCHVYLSPKIQQNTQALVASQNRKRQKDNQASVNPKEAHQIGQILSIQTYNQILSLYKEVENLQGILGKQKLYQLFEERSQYLEKIEKVS